MWLSKKEGGERGEEEERAVLDIPEGQFTNLPSRGGKEGVRLFLTNL